MKKLIEYSLYLLIFFLPLQTRWIWSSGEWEYLTKSLYGTEILLGIIFLLSTIHLIKNSSLSPFGRSLIRRQVANYKFIFNFLKNWKRYLKISFIFILFCFLVFLSTILAEDSSLSFYYLSKIIAGGVLIILIRSFADFTKSAYVFIVGMTLQAGLGIWQFLSQSIFASKWLGMAAQNASILGSSVIETTNGRWLRAYGALPHPNIFAGFLVVAILLLVILYTKKKNVPKNVLRNVLLIMAPLVILTTALFFTFSRAAWIALIVCLLFYLFINLKNKLIFQKIITLSFICFLVPVIFSFIYLPLSKARISGDGRLEVKSSVERVESFSESFKIIKNYPFFGAGPGNYTLAVHNTIDPNRASFLYQPAHNIYLLLLSEIGILSFSVLLLFCFAVWKQRSSLRILTPILILGLFDHYPFTLYSGIILTSFLLSLCFLYSNSKNTG